MYQNCFNQIDIKALVDLFQILLYFYMWARCTYSEVAEQHFSWGADTMLGGLTPIFSTKLPKNGVI